MILTALVFATIQVVVDLQDGLRNVCNARGKLKTGEIKKHMGRIKVWSIYRNLPNYLRQNEVVVGIGPAAIINISIGVIFKVKGILRRLFFTQLLFSPTTSASFQVFMLSVGFFGPWRVGEGGRKKPSSLETYRTLNFLLNTQS